MTAALLIKPVLWGCFTAALIIIALHLVGCAPRYVKDDPSLFGRSEVLRTVKGKCWDGKRCS